MARRCPWIKRIEILREKIIETATNSNFVFPISLQLYGVNLKYIIHSLKCLRCTTSICKDIRIRKLEFLATTPFHYAKINIFWLEHIMVIFKNIFALGIHAKICFNWTCS